MSIKKQFLKRKKVCKVTFKLPAKISKKFSEANVVGTFNNWEMVNPMKKLKDGSFTAIIELEKGKEYHFRYVMDNEKWVTDDEADGNAPTGFADSQNSVVRCIED